MKLRFGAMFILATTLAGCGGGGADALKLAPVAGIVKYKGAAVADATVVFYPEKGPAATGKTDAKGNFQVKTNGQLGTSLGKNKVTVVAVQQTGEIPPADGNEVALLEKQNAIPKKYNQAETTDLIVDVTAEGHKELVLDLTD